MYRANYTQCDDLPRIHAVMRAHPFATLVTAGPMHGLFATPLPTVLKAGGGFGTIECHFARANPHWKELAGGADALMMFQGPDAYITPSWYPTKAETHKVVPTWNYVTVHAYGRSTIEEDPAWLHRHVTELTGQQEGGSAQPWAVSDAPADFVSTMLRGIVGLRFEIVRVEGKWKMSQNRPAHDQQGVVDGLQRRGHRQDAAVAAIMSERIET